MHIFDVPAQNVFPKCILILILFEPIVLPCVSGILYLTLLKEVRWFFSFVTLSTFVRSSIFEASWGRSKNLLTPKIKPQVTFVQIPDTHGTSRRHPVFNDFEHYEPLLKKKTGSNPIKLTKYLFVILQF